MALAASSYIDLPIELKHPKKGLTNVRNNYQKCFLWCHVGHINPLKEHPGIIKKILKRLKYKIIFVLMYLAMRIS